MDTAKTTIFNAILIGLSILTLPLHAQEQKRINSYDIPADTEDSMGDTIDIDTGRLSFHVVDVSLPGNSDLPVQVGRRLSVETYGDGKKAGDLRSWELDTPVISGLEWMATCDKPWGTRKKAKGYYFGKTIGVGRGARRARQYWPEWNGVRIKFSNGSQQRYVPITLAKKSKFPAYAQFATDQQWIVYCGDTPTHIIAESPDGRKYHFRSHPKGSVHGGATGDARIFLVEDRHGNWVKYEYGKLPGNRNRGTVHILGDKEGLQRIHSNDGRLITLSYDAAGYVATVNANDRQWQYHYVRDQLAKVTLPDGRYWSISDTVAFSYNDVAEDCPERLDDLFVKRPSGATMRYKFRVIYNGLYGMHKKYKPGQVGKYLECGRVDTEDERFPNPRIYFTVAVTEKVLSGPDMPTRRWTYDYEEDEGSLDTEVSSLAETKKRTVTDPLGNRTVSFINRHYRTVKTGTVEREELFAPGTSDPLEIRTYRYEAGMTYGLPYGQSTPNKDLGTMKHLVEQTVTRGNDVFTTHYRDFEYGKATVTETLANDGSTSRIKLVKYKHEISGKWLLWQTRRVTFNDKLFNEYVYDNRGNVVEHNKFGSPYKTFGYHSSGVQAGNLAWEENALGQRTHYANYKRGKAQKTTRPDATSTSLIVDDNGWVTSETDARGVTTSYQHNALGWLTKIDRPAPWSDTVMTYPVLCSGTQIQDTRRGSKQTITWYDGLFRPFRVTSRPLSGGGLTTHIYRRYDAHGRQIFESFPDTQKTPTAGTATIYDALGRVTRTSQTVFPNPVTRYAYRDGNRTIMTDPEGHVATTTYRSFGAPDNSEITHIKQPEGVNTALSHDIYGNLETVRRYGTEDNALVEQTQDYFYDQRLRLCRHSVKETGDTLYEYDAANQRTGTAYGQAPGEDCQTLPVASKITRSYDTLGRVEVIDYPTGTPDIHFTYDENGNVTRNQRGIADWHYRYNTQDQLSEEKLLIDGRSYRTEYTFNPHGDLSDQTTPDNRRVSYSLNGLGQATALIQNNMPLARGLLYHSNGRFKYAAYANGFSEDVALNARQLVRAITVQYGSNKAIALWYMHDKNGQITQENNRAVAGENRLYRYDGLGQLTTMNGPWGTGSAVYDIFGNLRKKTLGSRQVEMQYFGTRVSRYLDSANGAWKDFNYDKRGNVTDNARVTLHYDAANQPTSMSGASNGSFTYDGNLKRVKQITDGKTTYSVYSQSGAILYRDNVTTDKRTDYLRAAGKTIARIVNDTRITYPHQNHLGSPVTATSSTGEILWRESYTPYGEKRINPSDNRDDEGFTGHIEDSASGLTYMQARYYDPVVGRFLSNDPVGFSVDKPMQFNRYAYTHNDPINYTDPTGEVAKGVIIVAAVTCAKSAACTKAVIKGAKKIGEKLKGPARQNSRAKRRAAREAQRKNGTPTSKSGKNQQGREPNSPRHQIKEGADGKPDGVVDGSKDTVKDHGPHVEAGKLKQPEGINKHGQPRLQNGKSKVEFEKVDS